MLETLKELVRVRREATTAGALSFVRHKIRTRSDVSFVNQPSRTGFGVVGAGTYVATVHLPLLADLGESFASIVSARGKNARSLAAAYGFGRVEADALAVIKDPNARTLLIASPHYLHPDHILAALVTGKYVYCEKPAAIERTGVERLVRALQDPLTKRIMIGFNRRFAPGVGTLMQKPWMRGDRPKEIQYRVNFGPKIANALSDRAVGGGRIHGAACHYVDLIAFLAGASIERVAAVALRTETGVDEDTFAAVLEMSDGSCGTLIFTSEGSRRTEVKEEIALSCGGHIARLSDFSRLTVDGETHTFARHTYGARDAWLAFLAARDSDAPVPVPLSEGIAASLATLAIQESMYSGDSVRVGLVASASVPRS